MSLLSFFNQGTKDALNKNFGAKTDTSTKLGNGLGLLSALGTMGTNAYSLANVDTDSVQDKVDAQVKQLQSLSNMDLSNSSLDDVMSSWGNNKLIENDYDADDYYNGPSTSSIVSGTLSSALSGATSGSKLGPWGAVVGGILGAGSSLLGGLKGKSTAQAAADDAVDTLAEETDKANQKIVNTYQLVANNRSNESTRNALANIARFGGNLYAFGGAVPSNGADWTNGLTMINAGGSHSENPYGGVPMGIAPDGEANLVQQDEVVWNDGNQKYVFSNELNVPRDTKTKYNLGEGKIAFSEAAKQLQKSSEERPNDPITKRTVNAALSDLKQAQELERQKKEIKEQAKLVKQQAKQMSKQYANGGHMFVLGGEPLVDLDFLYRKDYPWFTQGSVTLPNTTYDNNAFDVSNMGLPTVDMSSLETWTNFMPKTYPWLSIKPTTEKTAQSTSPVQTVQPKINLPTSGEGEGLRYAPALGSGLAVAADALGLTNTPDYSYADAITDAAAKYSQMPRISYQPLGDYLAYNPFDRLFYANQLGAQQAASRRGILNLSNGNRGTAMAGLLANSYTGNEGLGKLYRQAEEFNLDQRQKVAEFNRQTNQYNSEADIKAQMANAEYEKEKQKMLMDAALKSAALKQQEDQDSQAAKMKNLTNLFTNLGNVGIDSKNRHTANALWMSGVGGTPNQYMIDLYQGLFGNKEKN